ncbi:MULTISPECIES: accessory gene regulator AgrB [Mammaliicoccus]|jgi:accessory gene regulator B|uniref:Putative AgrB-like protein n=1 Tax=Mammaliicoccus lentus TaxID=42858 RepID=A0AAP1WKJ7_MAMLE|nr:MULTISPECIES: accessory gene regulator AgrB [Mammaliicoccus]HBV04127.1 accessory regulator AgrB [Staphylococcus sp.]MBF0749470.1 accessory gene regulator AgrB [Mammaliicoccus lentus]MBF0794734.1 accessory gene regulator AgrB [Mammaliicoccus lentus]MBF0840180.1 accessory gene regulator AgrB [Mammaliicoccus lentus]MBU6113740.1 accessory gene regulator AgrB [Mammaliicoccus lentus]
MYQPVQTQIDKIATSLQNSNNLDHVSYLKVKYGLEVFVGNIMKTVVIYGAALLSHIFFYTLIVHLSYFAIRYFAFGAHAKSTFLCTIQSLIMFVITPLIVININVPYWIFLTLALIGYIIIMKYAPMETKKHPLLGKWKKGLKLRSIIAATILIIISLFVKEPYQQLICLGLIFESVSLLPIFYKKEETIS